MPERNGTVAGTAGLLVLMWLAVGVSLAEAGQARSGFRAVLRIDAGLVRRDLAPREARAAAEAGATRVAAAGRAAPRVLPRAGGGVCVRKWIGRDRFRWVCR